MQPMSQRWRVRLLRFIVACAVALSVSGLISGLGGHSPTAHAAPKSACSSYWVDNSAYGYWDARYQTDTDTSCDGVYPPHAYGYLYPCSGVAVTANMDVWLTQSTTPGGTRLAESGRTGLECVREGFTLGLVRAG